MPSSNTAARCCLPSCHSISGTPMSLLRLPRVARRPLSPCAVARIDAIICVTVVLPLLPATAMTGSAKRARHCAAASPSARLLSATTTCGRSTSTSALHQGGRRAALARRGDVVVAVEALPAQRDVERAGRERPRVGRHAREADAAVAPHVQRRHRAGEFADGHQRAHWTPRGAHRRPRSESAARTCARSEYGCRFVPMTW